MVIAALTSCFRGPSALIGIGDSLLEGGALAHRKVLIILPEVDENNAFGEEIIRTRLEALNKCAIPMLRTAGSIDDISKILRDEEEYGLEALVLCGHGDEGGITFGAGKAGAKLAKDDVSALFSRFRGRFTSITLDSCLVGRGETESLAARIASVTGSVVLAATKVIEENDVKLNPSFERGESLFPFTIDEGMFYHPDLTFFPQCQFSERLHDESELERVLNQPLEKILPTAPKNDFVVLGKVLIEKKRYEELRLIIRYARGHEKGSLILLELLRFIVPEDTVVEDEIRQIARMIAEGIEHQGTRMVCAKRLIGRNCFEESIGLIKSLTDPFLLFSVALDLINEKKYDEFSRIVQLAKEHRSRDEVLFKYLGILVGKYGMPPSLQNEFIQEVASSIQNDTLKKMAVTLLINSGFRTQAVALLDGITDEEDLTLIALFFIGKKLIGEAFSLTGRIRNAYLRRNVVVHASRFLLPKEKRTPFLAAFDSYADARGSSAETTALLEKFSDIAGREITDIVLNTYREKGGVADEETIDSFEEKLLLGCIGDVLKSQ